MIKKTLIIVLMFISALFLVKGSIFVYFIVCKVQGDRIESTLKGIEEIQKAAIIYGMQHKGRLPDSIEELTKESESGDQHPLLRTGDITDSWHTPYQFERDGKNITITSAGPDRKFGTKDDLINKK
jgi:hypothetical protein